MSISSDSAYTGTIVGAPRTGVRVLFSAALVTRFTGHCIPERLGDRLRVSMPDSVLAYYRAALAGLRFVESRRPSGRRFGENADALWKNLAGELTAGDRLDLLIRDADAEWPGAFGGRTVFNRTSVAEDEPFGVGWAPLEAADAEELWRGDLRGTAAPRQVQEALAAVAQAWGLELEPFDFGDVNATEKLVLVGPSAIAAGVERFAADASLGWAEQVLVIATPEAHRQLAALGAALVNVNKPTHLLTAEQTQAEQTQPESAQAGKGTARGAARRLVISRDADARDCAAAEQAFGGD